MPDSSLLKIENLRAVIAGKQILKDVNLEIKPGEIHAIMGPNGSGKSTMSNALMGHPDYSIESGKILFKGEDVSTLSTDERARKGMFLGFQYPTSIPGVSVTNFLRSVLKAKRGEAVPARDFRKELKERMGALSMDAGFAKRYVNDGFSGGEKKRLEILQLSMLKPDLAILDEIDSGLDIDALKVVCEGINQALVDNPSMGYLIITHYQRMLDYVKPHVVHVFVNGRIVKTGGVELVKKLEKDGYDEFLQLSGAE